MQRIILTVSIVYKNILFCNAIFSQLNNFQAETFLHQTIFLVLTKDHRFTMFQINGILSTSSRSVNRLMSTIIKDDTILQNLAH